MLEPIWKVLLAKWLLAKWYINLEWYIKRITKVYKAYNSATADALFLVNKEKLLRNLRFLKKKIKASNWTCVNSAEFFMRQQYHKLVLLFLNKKTCPSNENNGRKSDLL